MEQRNYPMEYEGRLKNAITELKEIPESDYARFIARYDEISDRLNDFGREMLRAGINKELAAFSRSEIKILENELQGLRLKRNLIEATGGTI